MAAAVAGCQPPKPLARPSGPPELALSGLAAQPVIVLPTYASRVSPELSWGNAIGRPRDAQHTLDAELAAALEERGVTRAWILPEALQQSYKRNPTYATDPYALAEEPLRSPALAVGARLAEPLASQIRTMIALHGDARLLLAPIDLRFEAAGAGMGRAKIRLVLLDARLSEVRWIGDVKSDSSAAYGPSIPASLAARIADLAAKP
jgi:hypothetical protein